MAAVLMRDMLGQTLRELRVSSDLTLRDVSSSARVSLGYLSEIERGHKEASSELLNAICAALDVPLADVLRDVAERADAGTRITPLPLRTVRAA
ncbi:helix-turn-helix domain-containing protein [Propioniciclava tarda]|uniref:XRE family transcriptional regulator n=1 Tax=Propioniciclava tarda TaxID=433330 RepID=A0A4Q9KNB6_PROTD|nr:helix-turn-helix transcriptional regulator [Propioniciclava tarda]TBT96052.1 XRE family transcriptional regulator [Propioniciclava tarda]SMO43783.1 Helix-turn-helix domain-containing protein [Propioniciclava tarda]HOA88033.1 helix-turn-helix transcriptional regulator [Propioniciclava tarda]HQA30527.1 helix-turn-helix transcriptional regulator [Propioniciclava tarda]HQD59687.1 helix-turn-helix transcriptional regulator [Propioniciclava tarda]